MKILDLFCGAGGASMGYYLAGFKVVGVDIEPQPRYPFEFHQADALTFPLDDFDAIHASPPCQRYSKMTARHEGASEKHPDLVDPIRERLLGSGVPWVIENVPGAPLRDPIMLCGSMFYLGVRRHRLFEVSYTLPPPPACRHKEQGPAVGVYGNPGGSSKRDGIKFGGAEAWREAMGIDWMVSKELRESIPPAYTEWIGKRFLGRMLLGLEPRAA